MIQLDDMKIGIWIMCLDYDVPRYEEADGPPFGMSYSHYQTTPRRCYPPAVGAPIRIMAVSLPFLIAQDISGNIQGIDTRGYKWIRVEKRFVAHALAAARQAAATPGARAGSTQPTKNPCTRCGAPMRMRSTGHGFYGHCRECGYSMNTDGGLQ